MLHYCVNRKAQENGDHEVHVLSCNRLPNSENRKALGLHDGCHSAVRKAKIDYPKANGCFWCCNACHTT